MNSKTSLKENALEFEKRNEILEAIKMYEKLVQSSEADLDSYVNLSFLYFFVIDPGFSFKFHLSNETVENYWQKSLTILDEAEKKFGSNIEIQFWRHYYKYIFLGEKDFAEECIELTKQGNQNYIPYFYLINFFNGNRFVDQANRLWDEVCDGSTVKKRYIKEILKKYKHKFL
jgi:hypothetical protein